MKAPGYNSYRWIQQDWRSLRISKGKIIYDKKCGAKGTKFPSGKPRLCLPVFVIRKLMKTKSGKDILRSQINKKARAPKGKRVPWHPEIKKWHRKLDGKGVKDKKQGSSNKTTNRYKKWLPLKTVLKTVPAMQKKNVSKVARGKSKSAQTREGFIEAYKKTKGSITKMQSRQTGYSDQVWSQRRDAFISRHLKQMRTSDRYSTGWDKKGNPTNRHLGLVAWAYSPSPARLERWLKRNNA